VKERKKKEKLGIATVPQVNAPQYIQPTLFPSARVSSYRQLLREKNESIALFKKRAFDNPADVATENDIRTELLKSSIEELNGKSQRKLNKLLLDEFVGLGIKYEEAQLVGKAKKRGLAQEDIDRLEPFHWGYHFNQIIAERGGFDAIIANPPWEVFKPNAKEFFARYSDLVIKKKMDIKIFEKQKEELLKDLEIEKAWIEYKSEFPYVSSYFRSAEQYKNQISIVNGKKAGTDINLYKLFLELCFNLLKPSGYCGIIIPTLFYSGLGTKQLRKMVFSESRLDTVLGLSNERFIFEGVDHRFKFCLVTFKKGKSTDKFDTCFRIDPREAVRLNELEGFLGDKTNRVSISVQSIYDLYPETLSLLEFKSQEEYQLASRLSNIPAFQDKNSIFRDIQFCRELAPSSAPELFHEDKKPHFLKLFEGRMIHQFNHLFSNTSRYWISESDARALILGRKLDVAQKLDYQCYRLGFRKVASNTNERTMIATVIPPSPCIENLQTVKVVDESGNKIINNKVMIVLCAIWNSFTYDYVLRLKVAANINFFFVYNTPIPHITKSDRPFQKIVERAAKLICTTPEFDDLAAEVGLGSHTNGITDEVQRAQLRAELDGIIAHLYHLTETEFAHILQTFPIVPEATKIMALNAYRDVERGLI
jgi:hypothetical protein